MKKHDEPVIGPESRISIFTCSSGSAWRLIVGKHPFGKSGGTRGSIRTAKSGGEPRIPWVDATDVAGSARGDREIVEYALTIAKRIATTSGPGFAYGIEAVREFTRVLRMPNETREDMLEFSQEVEQVVSRFGKAHAREHKREMSLYPSMPPTDYQARAKAARAYRKAHKVDENGQSTETKLSTVQQATVVLEEVMIVPVAVYTVAVEHDCL